MAALKRYESEEEDKALARPSLLQRFQNTVALVVEAYLEIANLNPRKLHSLIGLGLGTAPVVVVLLLVNKFIHVVNPVLFGLLMIGAGTMGAIGVVTARKVERKRLPGQARIRDSEEQYHAQLGAIKAAMLPKKEATRRRRAALDEHLRDLEQLRAEQREADGADGPEQLAGAGEQPELPEAPADPDPDPDPDPE